MHDILDVTESQAKVLRAIAYYETKLGIKGATQYICSLKVPKELRVSGSTFNDNIQDLEKNLMVYRIRGTDSERETKPYIITDVGQIAWLRYFSVSEDSENIQKIFPNIQLSIIDKIIDQIQHHVINDIKEDYSRGVLQLALNSFHIENLDVIKKDYVKININETIELYGGKHHNLKTSFIRDYSVIHPTLYRRASAHVKFTVFGINFDDLEISIKDRVTFLFYYNLIQTFINFDNLWKLIVTIIETTKKNNTLTKIKSTKNLVVFINNLDSEMVGELSNLMIKRKNQIIGIIENNKDISRIMHDNLNDLNKYKDENFQEITNMFIKS